MTPTERLVDSLEAGGFNPRRNGSGWAARCPAHDDRVPSLSINEGVDGRALIHCHAGCETAAVVEALGLTLGESTSGRRAPPAGGGPAGTGPASPTDPVAADRLNRGKNGPKAAERGEIC